MVDQLLTVSGRKSREAPNVLTHGLVVLLDIGRGDVVHVGIADDLLAPNTRANAGRILALRTAHIGRLAIGFDEHGVIHVQTEGAVHGFQIGLVAIGG